MCIRDSASHLASRVDINEAFMVGGAAVKAADEGDSGKMVVIDRVSDDPYQSATGIYDCLLYTSSPQRSSPTRSLKDCGGATRSITR